MAEQGFKRKLTAILSADVIGYSRLMRDDEEATVRNIAASRVLISDLVQQHHGRVVDSPGDNILAEFASVVDAVNGAINIQKEIERSNTDTPKDRRMEFRIGINLGDVIEEEERIYGDGVNIAARVEGLALPGGIAISGTVYEHVKDKLSLGYHYLGEQNVKNIPEPVRVYRLLTESEDAGKMIGEQKPKSRKSRYIGFGVFGLLVLAVGIFVIWNNYIHVKIEPASVEKMAFPLPEKPSIAVLPFVNMSDDPNQEFFCDGITEEIITGLAKVSELFVIARNSSFAYKGKPVKVQQVAQDLGVRYVLEGSVRKSQENLRVTAQLIDALKGHHLWADRWDRKLEDVFTIQDDITMKITTAMQAKLTSKEQARIVAKGTNNLEAYLKILEAREHLMRFNPESNDRARQLAEEALDMDPQYGLAYAVLGKTHMLDVWLGASTSPKQSMVQAIGLIHKAIDLDESLGEAYGMLGFLYTMTGQYEKGIMEAEKAVALEPNSDLAHHYLGLTLRFASRPNDAIPAIKKAIRFNPFAPGTYRYSLGLAYLFSGQYEEALEECKKATTREPDNLGAQLSLTVAYGLSGRDKDARATAQEVLRINPKFSLEQFSRSLVYKNHADKDRFIDALRKAGLPETPPLPLPDKPSIAVLAFDNLSGDPEQEYFSDGISENIITVLSKVAELFVIARNSSFTYKGKPVKVQQIGSELGVRYVLEGSVQRSGDRVRINAQLIDAINGQHLWAEKYDRDFKDLFEIQDDITVKIVNALRIKLTEGERIRLSKSTKNPDVFLKSVEMTSLWNDGTKVSLMRFGQLAQEVIDIEPESSLGYTQLGWYHKGLADRYGISPQENIKKAFMLAQKALSIDEADSFAHTLMGSIYLLMRKYEEAISSGKRSIELQPNDAVAHALLGVTLTYAGRVDEAIAHLKQGMRLNPFPPYYYYYTLGQCYSQNGQYEDALAEFKKALQRAPNAAHIHISLAMNYTLAGREDEARASVTKALELDPTISVNRISKMVKFKNETYTKLLLDAMRKAGFPE
jgi:adenylate cyclase